MGGLLIIYLESVFDDDSVNIFHTVFNHDLNNNKFFKKFVEHFFFKFHKWLEILQTILFLKFEQSYLYKGMDG